ncbi:hypothetical protein AB4Y43_16905 [Paraburkholderia sp. BR10872]|uniref:hypothetical protein n=1 Tax=Paraburkholderia sp. BR10872 TaxID=3236989 RepID=UPI0034D17F88
MFDRLKTILSQAFALVVRLTRLTCATADLLWHILEFIWGIVNGVLAQPWQFRALMALILLLVSFGLNAPQG